jgi:hypothetical protein
MNLKLLIDGIVRQTTVLIAQLSTASGVRAPLAHIADQVFLELAQEIEAQGVKKQVVADMFGLAMRSYQKKMQRLTESATLRDRTLWEAVFQFVSDENPTRARVLQRFERDGQREVIAVLNDLVRSGLVFSTGEDNALVYGATPGDAQQSVRNQHDSDSLANYIWLLVFRKEAVTRTELASTLGCDEAAFESALQSLLASGRVRFRDGELRSTNVALPLGSEQGWETAVLDHFRTVATAIASKVARGVRVPDDERIGGSTFTFTIARGHPFEARVTALLKDTRQRVQALWDEVAEHNRRHPMPETEQVKVNFYVGQSVQCDDETTEDSSSEQEKP